MTKLLRLLAALLLVTGLSVCAAATRATLEDEPYYRAAAALERHPDHILFLAEYQATQVKHVAYLLTAIISGGGAVVGGTTLFALAMILVRVRRFEARAPR